MVSASTGTTSHTTFSTTSRERARTAATWAAVSPRSASWFARGPLATAAVATEARAGGGAGCGAMYGDCAPVPVPPCALRATEPTTGEPAGGVAGDGDELGCAA